MMPRRRSRVALFIAVVMVIMLYRVFQNSEWDPTGSYAGTKPKVPATHHEKPPTKDSPPAEKPIVTPGKDQHPPPLPPPKEAIKIPTLKTTLEEHGAFALPTAPTQTKVRWADDDTVPTTKLLTPVTTAKPAAGDGGIHAQNPPGRLDAEIAPTILTTSTSAPHWIKMPEQFPVAEESLITLPTGKPKPIPKVQFDFAPETSGDKKVREKRLQQVKTEMQKAWKGYRKNAWMHDELSPVSGRFRDPFCGWAASLVDSLDTLWIMGLETEFDEAAKAVKDIDFTRTSNRRDIPVFETIIRYLGGLTAAYDISGGAKGKYPMLLDKALDLAEILMGVFDTPNRMPILYYNALPEYASQPHRAGFVSVAELGTMSMEFTRLAQITGKQKYYDAIARITNALEDLQNRGTSLDGIFPENLDASGCNRTATEALNAAARKEEAEREEEAAREAAAREAAEAEIAATLAGGSSSEGVSKEEEMYGTPAQDPELKRGNGSEPAAEETSALARRAVRVEGDAPATQKRVPATGLKSEWDCVEQGIVPGGYGYEQYSMGGSQDSTYEYFPKQYLMLGGLEPKYKTMHIKTVEAVKKWLLYRPMVPNDRNILFSAKASTRGKPDADLQKGYEVTHLTCFLGGMFGLGGKIFNRPEDVEIGKKLTDGCVWAYESTTSGIMPEGSEVVPCKSMASCPWNETVWWELLDPQHPYRDQEIQKWEENELKRKEDAKFKIEEAERKKAEELKTPPAEDEKEISEDEDEDKIEVPRDTPRPKPKQKQTGDYPRTEPGNNGTYSPGSSHGHAKRSPLPPPGVADPRKEKASEEAIDVVIANDLESKLDLNHATDNPKTDDAKVASEQFIHRDPIGDLPAVARPPTHEEFVKGKIKDYKIPPGFVTIPDKRYILRPEAIESVWYMYRITGDSIWQEKGWKMFESVIKATGTDHGHSAIDDVLSAEPRKSDEMESFWMAETLKYFYLLFTTPDVISLDDWVLNTEAHPFKRPAWEE